MHSVRRLPPLSILLQMAMALLLGVGLFSVLHSINPVVSQIVLILLLSFVCFIALSIPRIFLMQRQSRNDNRRPNPRDYRPGSRRDGPGDRGDGGSGVREPRRPYPPAPTPRAVALEPEPDRG